VKTRRLLGKHRLGFTLIEVLIVVAVIGILAAVGYPAYVEHTQKARRADGKARMLEIMQAQERFYTTSGPPSTYTANLTQLGFPVNGLGLTFSDDQWYLVGAAACAGTTIAQCVVLTAFPQTAQLADTKCAVLTLNSQGVRTEAGTGTVQDCW